MRPLTSCVADEPMNTVVNMSSCSPRRSERESTRDSCPSRPMFFTQPHTVCGLLPSSSRMSHAFCRYPARLRELGLYRHRQKSPRAAHRRRFSMTSHGVSRSESEMTQKSWERGAPRTAADSEYGLIFYHCSVTSEEGCVDGTFRLARPWGPDGTIYWINCYLGSAINAVEPYTDMSGNPFMEANFLEYGSYGPGYAVNASRKQISPAEAKALLTTAATALGDLGAYYGNIPADIPSMLISSRRSFRGRRRTPPR